MYSSNCSAKVIIRSGEMFYFSHSTKPYVNCTTYCIHICYSIPPPNISMQQRLHARSKRDSKVSIFNHFETIGDIEKTSSSRLNPFFYSILYCTFVKITNPPLLQPSLLNSRLRLSNAYQIRS